MDIPRISSKLDDINILGGGSSTTPMRQGMKSEDYYNKVTRKNSDDHGHEDATHPDSTGGLNNHLQSNLTSQPFAFKSSEHPDLPEEGKETESATET